MFHCAARHSVASIAQKSYSSEAHKRQSIDIKNRHLWRAGAWNKEIGDVRDAAVQIQGIENREGNATAG